jgi:hypothetical protein
MFEIMCRRDALCNCICAFVSLYFTGEYTRVLRILGDSTVSRLESNAFSARWCVPVDAQRLSCDLPREKICFTRFNVVMTNDDTRCGAACAQANCFLQISRGRDANGPESTAITCR